ncbi:MAG: macro domain-containing protein [Gemmatimonadota bacterium]
MRAVLGEVRIYLTHGDIARQPGTDVVVNAANAELRMGGGVAGALHQAAGPALEARCRSLAPIAPGEAVITEAFRLPNRWVVHALGPVYGRDEPPEELLARCYENALALAEGVQARSIAFPAISTGAFGYPMDEAAEVALQAVADAAGRLESIREVFFVLYSALALAAHEKALKCLIRRMEHARWSW